MTALVCLASCPDTAIATAIAETLRWRLHGRPSAVVDNLIARIRAWWVMAIVVALTVIQFRYVEQKVQY